MEVVRCHNYTDDESSELLGRIDKEEKAANDADADGGGGDAQPGEQTNARRAPSAEPREGWWVIGEGLRQKGLSVGGERVGSNEVMPCFTPCLIPLSHPPVSLTPSHPATCHSLTPRHVSLPHTPPRVTGDAQHACRSQAARVRAQCVGDDVRDQLRCA